MTFDQIALQGNLSPMLKSLIKGKYQYLTFLMSSTACMFFWLAPNHHKMKLIKPHIVRKASAKMGHDSTSSSSKASKKNGT